MLLLLLLLLLKLLLLGRRRWRRLLFLLGQLLLMFLLLLQLQRSGVFAFQVPFVPTRTCRGLLPFGWWFPRLGLVRAQGCFWSYSVLPLGGPLATRAGSKVTRKGLGLETLLFEHLLLLIRLLLLCLLGLWTRLLL